MSIDLKITICEIYLVWWVDLKYVNLLTKSKSKSQLKSSRIWMTDFKSVESILNDWLWTLISRKIWEKEKSLKFYAVYSKGA